mmetsp:Transcript_14401/g.56648  ORF Transcript_14401/g.56648 Transcript_14401/m.56648 type:complete len:347 (+) Transcript_14401:2621-3661(+)
MGLWLERRAAAVAAVSCACWTAVFTLLDLEESALPRMRLNSERSFFFFCSFSALSSLAMFGSEPSERARITGSTSVESLFLAFLSREVLGERGDGCLTCGWRMSSRPSLLGCELERVFLVTAFFFFLSIFCFFVLLDPLLVFLATTGTESESGTLPSTATFRGRLPDVLALLRPAAIDSTFLSLIEALEARSTSSSAIVTRSVVRGDLEAGSRAGTGGGGPLPPVFFLTGTGAGAASALPGAATGCASSGTAARAGLCSATATWAGLFAAGGGVAAARGASRTALLALFAGFPRGLSCGLCLDASKKQTAQRFLRKSCGVKPPQGSLYSSLTFLFTRLREEAELMQ